MCLNKPNTRLLKKLLYQNYRLIYSCFCCVYGFCFRFLIVKVLQVYDVFFIEVIT